jgi:putative ABC transport system substrate-binding protein
MAGTSPAMTARTSSSAGLLTRRREFITLLGAAAAAWPLGAQAQQPAMPVIGFLHLTSRDETRGYLPDFHQGLADIGYMEGKNVAIEYRWGEGHNDRLPSLIAELVHRQVSVIVTLESTLAALAAKEATQTIPIIFMQGADPVRIGLVDSLSHPGRNLTGINLFLAEVAAKRLELLLVLVPGVRSVGYLRNPTNPIFPAGRRGDRTFVPLAARRARAAGADARIFQQPVVELGCGAA